MYTKGDKMTSSDEGFGFLLPSQGVKCKMKPAISCLRKSRLFASEINGSEGGEEPPVSVASIEFASDCPLQTENIAEVRASSFRIMTFQRGLFG